MIRIESIVHLAPPDEGKKKISIYIRHIEVEQGHQQKLPYSNLGHLQRTNLYTF